jgi:hypothetical protein
MQNPAVRASARRHDVITVVTFTIIVAVLVILRQEPPPEICVVGDAGARLAARIPPQLANVYVDSTRLALGIGSGAIGSWRGLGEAMAVNGQVFVRSTDVSTPQYYRLLQARRFQTNAFAYVPHGTRARERVALPRGGRFSTAWQELGNHYPDGALIAGFVQFRTLHTIAISRAATHGLPVLQNPARYYTEPMESSDSAWAYVIGLVARDRLLPPRSDDPLISRLFARRTDGRLDTYALALQLAAAPEDLSRAQNLRPISLGRITGDSVIEQGEVSVFPADHVAACTDAISTPTRVGE